MTTEQAIEHSDAGDDAGTFDTVAAAVAELERREQSRKAERKTKAEAPSDDDKSDPAEDEDPRKVQKYKPEPKEKAPKKEPEPKAEDESEEDDDEPDEDDEVTPDDEDDEPEEPKRKQAKPPLDDSEEVEHEGKTYRVPKDLKDSFLRHSDYTRKTQELAQERQVVHQTYAQANESIQQVQTAQQTLMQFAQAMVGEPPPLELAQDNPGEYLRQRTLHEQRQQALTQIAEQGQTVSREQQRLAETQKVERLKQQEAVMVQHAPELRTPQGRQQFANVAGQYLQNFGFSPDDALAIDDARTVLLVRRLLILEHQAAQRAKTEGDVSKKLANVPSKTLKPGAAGADQGRSNQDAKRKFERSPRSMKDVEAYLKATSR